MSKWLLVSVMILSGCSTSYLFGTVTETTSSFDGSKEIMMSPVCLSAEASVDACTMMFGLSRDTKMSEDDATLTVDVYASDIFAQGESLRFNIDGDSLSLVSMDMLPTPGSAKGRIAARYKVNKHFIKRLLDAKRVGVRIELRASYREGVFSQDRTGSARPAFREFYLRAFGNENNALK